MIQFYSLFNGDIACDFKMATVRSQYEQHFIRSQLSKNNQNELEILNSQFKNIKNTVFRL